MKEQEGALLFLGGDEPATFRFDLQSIATTARIEGLITASYRMPEEAIPKSLLCLKH
jgi:hypothetical protein